MENHEIIIDFMGKEAMVRSFPEEKYSPEFLGQDESNLFYYIDSLDEPGPDYVPKIFSSDEKGNVYLVLSPSKASDPARISIVEKLLEYDTGFRKFYDSHFKKFSLFIGEDGHEMEPARITKAPEHVPDHDAIKFHFHWEDIKGTLSIPGIPGFVPVAEIKKRWDFEKRALSEIPVKQAKMFFSSDYKGII